MPHDSNEPRKHPHQLYCNASRDVPIGGPICSCIVVPRRGWRDFEAMEQSILQGHTGHCAIRMAREGHPCFCGGNNGSDKR